jgi:hypothetical protein
MHITVVIMSLLKGMTFTCSGQEQTITVLLLMKWQDLALSVVMAMHHLYRKGASHYSFSPGELAVSYSCDYKLPAF